MNLLIVSFQVIHAVETDMAVLATHHVAKEVLFTCGMFCLEVSSSVFVDGERLVTDSAFEAFLVPTLMVSPQMLFSKCSSTPVALKGPRSGLR